MKIKGIYIIGIVAAIGIALAVWGVVRKHNTMRAQLASTRQAGMMYGQGPGFMIPSGGPNITPFLTDATPYESASYLAGPYSSELKYTLSQVRPLDYGNEVTPSGGTLKSEGHFASNHGEAAQKNQDILRNSTNMIPVTVPAPITVPLIIASSEVGRGNSFLGTGGLPRGPHLV